MTRPTASLIRIDKGQYRGVDISSTTATLADVEEPDSGYYLLDGPMVGHYIHHDIYLTSIYAWRPCVAIPIGELSFLRDVFMGSELSKNQMVAIQRLSHYLPRTATDESE